MLLAAASTFAVARPTITASPGFNSPSTTWVKRPSLMPVRIWTGLGSPFGPAAS